MRDPIKGRKITTSTQAILSASLNPLLVIAWTNIQIQKAKQARLIRPPTTKEKIPKRVPIRANISFLTLDLLFVFHVRFGHGFAQRRHLFEQFLEFDARKAFDHWRQLGDNLGHVTSQFTG